MPVLDATFLVDVDGEPDRYRDLLRSWAEATEEVVVPAQAAIEFASGEKDPAAAMADLRRSFRVVPVDDDLQLEAARLARQAFAGGVFPGWADLQIAATARQLGMAVVTANRKHFEPLGIEVVAYGD